jgi:hypothetical protein
MKKSLFFTAILCCLVAGLTAQVPGVVSSTMQANHVKAKLNSNGALFNEGLKGQFIPIQPGLAAKSLLGGSGLWVAGLDSAGNLQTSVTVNNNTDFHPGSIHENTGLSADSLNNIWTVSCAEINQHRADYADNGVIDNPIASIFSYPGDGNPQFEAYNNVELPLTERPLAGYFDGDDDGRYFPNHGDYPSIEVRGCPVNAYANAQSWFVSNDLPRNALDHTTMNLEVQTQVFAFKSLNTSPLNNTIYVRYRVINRSASPLHSCYFGVFADFNIGNAEDDFLGTIPEQNILYGYNGDNFDEGNFGAEIPVMAMDMLRGPLDTNLYEVQGRHHMVVDNANNLQPSQYYNLLSGRFADGSPAPNGGVMFPDNPNIAAGNSEVAAGNTPGQRAGLASYGPFNLLPYADNEVIVAYYYVHTPGATPLENVQQLYSDASIIQALFDDCFQSPALSCSSTSAVNEAILEAELSIYPNPATTDITIESKGARFRHVALVDVLGRQVRAVELNSPTQLYKLSTEGLPSGVYVLRVDGTARMVVVGR